MTKSKRDQLAEALARGMVSVVVDATIPGVMVPDFHKDNGALVLNLSFRFEGGDLDLGLEAVTCTLSFGGQSSFVVLPYEAIIGYAMKGQKQGIFFGTEPEAPVEEPKRPQLRLIRGGKADD